MGNVAVLWDIENVTPSLNSIFIDGVSEYSESLGRVVAARAYCDWSKQNFRHLAPQLTSLYFYLVHIPRRRSQKNAADIQLVSDALELLTKHEHIDTYILITGDSDFRALVLALRRAGKQIHIICDLQNASQELLALADTFKDVRELLPDEEEEAAFAEAELRDEKPKPLSGKSEDVIREYWYECLAEASSVMLQENKFPNPGSIKLRMRMLNPNFNEKNLGFNRWNDFLYNSAKSGYARIEDKDGQTLVHPGPKYKEREGPLHRSLDALLHVLLKLDNGNTPAFHEAAQVNQQLISGGIDVKMLGFRRFKGFIQAAETRGLVESKVVKLRFLVKREEKRSKTRGR